MNMTKTLVLAAVVAASAVFATSASAGEGYGGPGCRGGEWGGGGYSRFDHVGSFCKEHGVKFSHGYFYPGLVQKHFTEKWFDEHYKTEMAFDPHAHCPYYFCAGHGVWYPIHYIEKVGPGAKGPGPVVAAKGGAPVGGAAVGGAPVGGAAVGGAPVGGAAVGGAPAGDGPAAGPANGAPVGGAGAAPDAAKGAVKAAPAPDAAAAPGVAAAKPASPAAATAAKDATPENKEVQQARQGTFDDEILN